MKNFIIAKIFKEMADAYEIMGVRSRSQAYRRAAERVENLANDIEKIYNENGLANIYGLDKNIQEKVEEYIKTGKIIQYNKLLNEVSHGLIKIKGIPGLGVARVRTLHKELGVKNINQLKSAAKSQRIRRLEGFGEKIEQAILTEIKEMAAAEKRYRLDQALKIAENLLSILKENKNFHKLSLTGSLRRMRSTIGGIDILAIAKDRNKASKSFTSLPGVDKVLRQDRERVSIRLETGMQAKLWLIKEESWGAAWQFFTGSKDHNTKLRNIAIKKNYKLNEYGLFSKSSQIAGKTEKEVYHKLGLSYIEPELREDLGELEAAAKRRLPKLIKYADIRGDLHVHTDWSDGDSRIEEMVAAAKKRGYEYVCISDHSVSRAIANGLDVNRLKKQILEVRRIDKKAKGIKVLVGTEVDILKDGRLDLPNEILSKLDFVIASIHSGFKMGEKKITERIIKAIENKEVNAIGHPTGRLINQRSGYRIDLGKIIKAAADNDVALEINANPMRLDLDYAWAKEAVKQGAKLVINTDAHTSGSLKNMHFGLAQARRGWAEKKDVINTYTLKKLLYWLKKR
jgi:DNA polymerase (family 10)